MDLPVCLQASVPAILVLHENAMECPRIVDMQQRRLLNGISYPSCRLVEEIATSIPSRNHECMLSDHTSRQDLGDNPRHHVQTSSEDFLGAIMSRILRIRTPKCMTVPEIKLPGGGPAMLLKVGRKMRLYARGRMSRAKTASPIASTTCAISLCEQIDVGQHGCPQDI